MRKGGGEAVRREKVGVTPGGHRKNKQLKRTSCGTETRRRRGKKRKGSYAPSDKDEQEGAKQNNLAGVEENRKECPGQEGLAGFFQTKGKKSAQTGGGKRDKKNLSGDGGIATGPIKIVQSRGTERGEKGKRKVHTRK